jgi:hypothetical protein
LVLLLILSSMCLSHKSSDKYWRENEKGQTEQLVQVVTLLNCIWKLPSSNLTQDTDNPDRGFLWLSSAPSGKC